jgi:hypothetical protein
VYSEEEVGQSKVSMVTEPALDLVTGDAVPWSKEGGQSMQEEMH